MEGEEGMGHIEKNTLSYRRSITQGLDRSERLQMSQQGYVGKGTA